MSLSSPSVIARYEAIFTNVIMNGGWEDCFVVPPRNDGGSPNGGGSPNNLKTNKNKKILRWGTSGFYQTNY